MVANSIKVAGLYKKPFPQFMIYSTPTGERPWRKIYKPASKDHNSLYLRVNGYYTLFSEYRRSTNKLNWLWVILVESK